MLYIEQINEPSKYSLCYGEKQLTVSNLEYLDIAVEVDYICGLVKYRKLML